jgi:hypothetical protein
MTEKLLKGPFFARAHPDSSGNLNCVMKVGSGLEPTISGSKVDAGSFSSLKYWSNFRDHPK